MSEPVKSTTAESPRSVIGNAHVKMRTIAASVAFQAIFEAVGASRQYSQGGAEHPLAVVLQFAHVRLHGRLAVFCGEFVKALLRAPDGHELGEKIAFALDRRANVGENHAEQVAIDLSRALDQYGRDTQAFLINLGRERHGARTHAADVGVMRAIGRVEGRLP